MVCDMTISEAGHLSHYEFYNAVMHSKARFTYNEVANILEGNKRLRTQFSPLVEMLENLEALYKKLNIAREERGAIAFETVETQFLFDEAGQVAKIIPRTRNEAHKIIEECMLCANVATARFLEKNKKATLYRVHAGPNVDKLSDLRKYLGIHGVDLGGGETPKPGDYNAVLRHIQDLPNFKVLQTMLLRSLKQAMYSPENEGHFGLSYPAYTHFTSPIRRYPDLMVHRAIKAVLKGASDAEGDMKGDSLEALQEMGEHCSLTERIADDATREVSQALKCRFMAGKVGEIYQGFITTVVPFGLFIELKDVYVEGLVHVTQLGQDYFVYDQARQRMVGERTRVIYQLGDTVEVKLVRVDLDANRIDLQLLDSPLVVLDLEKSDKPKKKRKKRKG
jgi:ribonuclease R